ncbi:MAG: hypothetical protein KJ630_19985, partial [Proteobacteria bacterium]|nr:hypothetical protein [Pseudomonadota bacterium]
GKFLKLVSPEMCPKEGITFCDKYKRMRSEVMELSNRLMTLSDVAKRSAKQMDEYIREHNVFNLSSPGYDILPHKVLKARTGYISLRYESHDEMSQKALNSIKEMAKLNFKSKSWVKSKFKAHKFAKGGNLSVVINRPDPESAKSKHFNFVLFNKNKKKMAISAKNVKYKFSNESGLLENHFLIKLKNKVNDSVTLYVIDNYSKKRYKFVLSKKAK